MHDEPAFEIAGYAALTPQQRAHFESSLLHHFLRFGAVAGTLQGGDALRVHTDRGSGYADLLLQLEGQRLLVCDMAAPGRSMLSSLRGFLRSYPRPVTFPPLSLRALDAPPIRTRKRVINTSIKARLRLIGQRDRFIAREDWLRALLPALYDDADLASAVADAEAETQRLAAGSPWWYPRAVNDNGCALLTRLGVHYQAFAWDAAIDQLTAVCDYCLGWLRSVPAAGLPGPAFLVRGSTALWQCPQCGGLYMDDESAGKAGTRAMLSPRQLREHYGVDPPRPLAAVALPAGLSRPG